jgi:hypothetical protein
MEAVHPEKILQIIVVGPKGSGKTEVSRRWARGEYLEEKRGTTALDMISKQIELDGKLVEIQMRHHPRFIPGKKMEHEGNFFEAADMFFWVWDADKPEAINTIPDYKEMIKSQKPVIFIRAKGDAAALWNECEKKITAIAEQAGIKLCRVVQVSAKENVGFDKLSQAVCDIVAAQNKEQQDKFEALKGEDYKADWRVGTRGIRVAKIKEFISKLDPRNVSDKNVAWLILQLNSIKDADARTYKLIHNFLFDIMKLQDQTITFKFPTATRLAIEELLALLDDKETSLMAKAAGAAKENFGLEKAVNYMKVWGEESELIFKLAEGLYQRDNMVISHKADLFAGINPETVPKEVTEIFERHFHVLMGVQESKCTLQ